MNKEQFEMYKGRNDFMAIALEYWKETKPSDYPDYNIEQFVENFNLFLQAWNSQFIPQINKIVEISRIRQKVMSYYEEKFKINE